MLIFDNHSWQTNSEYPDTNYIEDVEGANQPKWVVPDSSEIAGKVRSTPYWRPMEDENGNLIDIIAEEPPVNDEDRVNALKNQLDELDRQAVRPLRAIAAENDTEEDREKLRKLEEQAENIRAQIAEIEGKEKI